MPRSSRTSSGHSSLDSVGATIGALALWWLWVPAVVGIMWFITHVAFGGLHVQRESWDLWFNGDVWHGSLLWLYLAIGFVGSAIIAGGVLAEDLGATAAVSALVFVGLAAFSTVNFVGIMWHSQNRMASYYDSQTTFYVPNPANLPMSLRYLLKGAHRGPDGCLYSSSNEGTRVCRGTLPQSGWDARVSSAAGALTVMNRTSGTSANVDLLPASLTYLQGEGKDGVWSAIRDGKGAITPTEGVVEWSGVGNPTECYFSGKNNIDKAIWGTRGNSLSTLLAAKYPNLFWQSQNVYGYCDGSKPVIVFLMEKQAYFQHVTMAAPAGAVLVTGSRSGAPVFNYEETPKHLPGPSYPITVAAAQRVNVNWAAGRKWLHAGFGFEPASSNAQMGNVSEYLLKSKRDGHQYYVTPLTLNSSASQLFVAYAVVRADTVRSGHLNKLSVYVLSPNDPRVVNVDNLEATAKDYVSQQDPGFFSSGGQLIEFTPVDGNVWRAFGELNGRVVYRLDISANNSIQPNLVSLESFTGTTSTKDPNKVCGTSISQLSQAQIENCLKLFASGLSIAGVPG